MPPVGFGETEGPSPIGRPLDGSPQSNSTPLTPLSTPSHDSPGSWESISPHNSEMLRLLANNIDLPHGENSISILANNLAGYPRIAYPREQSLLDLLRQSSGTHSIRDLRNVRLRVVASVVSLSRLSSCTPRLQTLRLDGSGLASLREIGTGLRHLRVLYVSRCGLTSLDGTYGLTTLQELHAADNSIENLAPCAALINVQVLNFDRNQIDNLSINVGLLSFCPRLVQLSLLGTPVSRRNNYKESVVHHLPNLKILDGVPIDSGSQDMMIMETEETDQQYEVKSDSESTSCSIEVSSMTEPVSDDEDMPFSPASRRQSSEISSPKGASSSYVFESPTTIAGGSRLRRRPATAVGVSRKQPPFTRLSTPVQRPKTALPNTRTEDALPKKLPDLSDFEPTPSGLTSGGVVCGSIGLALSRLRRSSSLLQGSGVPALRSVRPRRPDKWLLAPPSNEEDQEENSGEDEGILKDEILSDSERKACPFNRSRLESIEKILSLPLPERPEESTPFVELEMGVTASIAVDEPKQSHDEESEDALKASKKWRKTFKLYRRKMNNHSQGVEGNGQTSVDPKKTEN